MADGAIETVRGFNRIVTQRIGALEEEYLARGRPLGASRVLWEIGRDGVEVGTIRTRLGLDNGYTSRLLRRLEDEGLIALEPGHEDGRTRVARLTARGRVERKMLDRRSDELARSLLEPLEERQRERLVDAMRVVERLLTAGAVAFEAVRPTSRAARFCFRSYFDELDRRFETGFDPGRSIPIDDDELVEPRGLVVVAFLHGEPVGCGALKLQGDVPAYIKRMWVAPEARGLGLGRRLLGALEAHARRHGATVAHLETNRALPEAIALYRSAGWREVAPFNDELYAHHWFEKRLDVA
jgi:DNA-binding MarR family transcriptional regulator/GNAT superfamily N-acetyltransferase